MGLPHIRSVAFDVLVETLWGVVIADNLTVVTTDLENIIGARDFLQVIVTAPLQSAISIWGLYLLLGWR